jgi:hypothetical protein
MVIVDRGNFLSATGCGKVCGKLVAHAAIETAINENTDRGICLDPELNISDATQCLWNRTLTNLKQVSPFPKGFLV